MNINQQFLAQMQEAAQLLQTEGPMAATAAIQRALNGGATPPAPSATPSGQGQPEVLIDINPVSAAEVVASIEKLASAPPEFFDYVRKLMAARK